MGTALHAAILIWLATVPVPASGEESQQQQIVVRTNPEVPANGFQPLRMYAIGEYEHSAQANLPTDLSPNARIGTSTIRGTDRLVVVDGTLPSIRLIVDTDGDQDLREEEPVQVKLFRGSFRSGEVPSVEGYLLRIMIQIDDTGEPLQVFQCNTFERSGTLPLKREVMFLVQASAGDYSSPYTKTFFDLNGDGELDASGPQSDERFELRDRFVNIDGASYEFGISSNGDTFTLSPTREWIAPRISLAVGQPAPDFEFVDLLGGLHRLSAYDGKSVLLYSWGTWCGPCAQLLPTLKSIHDELHDAGLEIVGINRRDSLEGIMAYIEAYSLHLLNFRVDEEFLDLYRMTATPSTVLIDCNGLIAGRSLRGDSLAAAIRQAVAECGVCAYEPEDDSP